MAEQSILVRSENGWGRVTDQDLQHPSDMAKAILPELQLQVGASPHPLVATPITQRHLMRKDSYSAILNFVR